mmetsp:Transcript_9518/g.19600  ORF Transcript_9518/g.19600 Transcript_9518/m.19600 type:complete len:114 (+) Transcript_9518:84-425(+)
MHAYQEKHTTTVMPTACSLTWIPQLCSCKCHELTSFVCSRGKDQQPTTYREDQFQHSDTRNTGSNCKPVQKAPAHLQKHPELGLTKRGASNMPVQDHAKQVQLVTSTGGVALK